MAKVYIETDDITLETSGDEELFEICQRKRASVIFGCRNATCGSCLIAVVDGHENLSPPSQREKALLKSMFSEPNDRLACQCKVHGDVTLSVP